MLCEILNWFSVFIDFNVIRISFLRSKRPQKLDFLTNFWGAFSMKLTYKENGLIYYYHLRCQYHCYTYLLSGIFFTTKIYGSKLKEFSFKNDFSYSNVRPIFQIIFRTFLKGKNKILSTLKLSYFQCQFGVNQ